MSARDVLVALAIIGAVCSGCFLVAYVVALAFGRIEDRLEERAEELRLEG